MIKIEAKSLESAYQKAVEELGVSVEELDVLVVQYPSKGIFGLFSKPAVVVAKKKDEAKLQPSVQDNPLPSVAEEKSDAQYQEESTLGFEALDEPLDDEQIARQIEQELKTLLIQKSCFDIDVVEVDVADNTALIFIDGEDAPLLIGKEGYRYNALSYMLFNWIHAKYGLYVKLEIAQFLTMQQEMIRNLLEPLIEEIRMTGRGRTKILDGILVQIALEQLREAFPDKYVAIKTHKDGGRYVLVNEFNKK